MASSDTTTDVQDATTETTAPEAFTVQVSGHGIQFSWTPQGEHAQEHLRELGESGRSEFEQLLAGMLGGLEEDLMLALCEQANPLISLLRELLGPHA
ncbi:hypothetical protein IPM09_02830 [Candidatus Saccharibacteria bacterium]|nr:MAG: hypothetical protein IPM09_02830 [Candidatus Saccharibacteria bacterium]